MSETEDPRNTGSGGSTGNESGPNTGAGGTTGSEDLSEPEREEEDDQREQG
jgi:hypothetical protein